MSPFSLNSDLEIGARQRLLNLLTMRPRKNYPLIRIRLQTMRDSQVIIVMVSSSAKFSVGIEK
ncbi:MAG: hypothetical protein DRH11_01950 [Deltaproteobacteria bacterium]|nr:MAG: hypothetical protein DRH11_01950 [Deltaproteobacteria bacterium]